MSSEKTHFLLSEYYPIAAITTTPKGVSILQLFCQEMNINLYIPKSIPEMENVTYYETSLKEHLESIWDNYNAFIFCLATGAVVRLIAPLLKHKNIDPPVVVIDENNQFVISLCGGHAAGGDRLTNLLAAQMGTTPIITGSSNACQVPAIDILGKSFGWHKGGGDWNGVSGAIARNEPTEIRQECGNILWKNNLLSPNNFIFEKQEDANIKARIWISANERLQSNYIIPEVQWYPRILWVGIGCERDTDIEVITEGITETLRKYNLGEKAIAGLASIDIKADEKGLIEYCQMRNIPLITFPAEKLKLVSVPHPSKRVLEEVGTASVAESAALMAAKTDNLLVSKEIYKIEGKKGAITVAIAVAEREYIGQDGEIYLIGTGPGNLTQITSAAKSAIIAADVVIGYGLYIDLIETLLRPEQIIEKMPITQEKQRAERSIELAKWGLKVAVISSGDIGIYAMGGLVLEQLKLDNWDGQKPGVQILPGITALQSAASRLGTPIMHDFCAISLSDLLTPWAVIEKRLNAAASADFVVGLYNPKSQNRTEQIAIAQRIFLQYRDEKTPVGIVKSAYREDEEIKITTLGEMLEYPIDMLTTIIIGNQSTMNYKNWLITPRGYNGL